MKKTNRKIQIDMLAVGLGAGILTQVRSRSDEAIAILADGGVGPSFRQDTVKSELSRMFADFQNSEARLDLIVGTHYDRDHLAGLIPIAEDDTVQIGQVWLPPVKDDTDALAADIRADDSNLAIQFFEDDGVSVLRAYLFRKARAAALLRESERRAAQRLAEGREHQVEALHYVFPEHDNEQHEINLNSSIAQLERNLEWHEAEAAARLGGKGEHETSEFDSMASDAREFAIKAEDQLWRSVEFDFELDWWWDRASVDMLAALPAALASVRRSTARDAITAIYLHKLVVALRSRRQPIRPVCHMIPDGTPVRFVWKGRPRGFVMAAPTKDDVTITLLGPSRGLVVKHARRIPVGTFVHAFLSMYRRITSKSISASNQLSYIFVIAAAGQRILISGDAGCYDFRSRHKKYFPALISELRALSVLQIAHHGGRNYDFYNVLLEAGFARESQPTFLLLSHGIKDLHRPSDQFRDFLAQLDAFNVETQLLFSCEPTRSAVAPFVHRIAPLAGVAAAANSGRAQLSFEPGEEKFAWAVKRHVVHVP